jgi:hypothetical protein
MAKRIVSRNEEKQRFRRTSRVCRRPAVCADGSPLVVCKAPWESGARKTWLHMHAVAHPLRSSFQLCPFTVAEVDTAACYAQCRVGVGTGTGQTERATR